jgi:hypothetical protein
MGVRPLLAGFVETRQNLLHVGKDAGHILTWMSHLHAAGSCNLSAGLLLFLH